MLKRERRGVVSGDMNRPRPRSATTMPSCSGSLSASRAVDRPDPAQFRDLRLARQLVAGGHPAEHHHGHQHHGGGHAHGVPVALPWVWIGTVGTLIVLVVYLLATVGAAGMLLRTRRVPRWELVIPAASVAVLGYTLYRNVVPYPTGAAFWLPVTAGAWIAVALAAVLLSPALVRRIGRRLTEEEGLA